MSVGLFLLSRPNSVPNDTTFDLCKLHALVDNKLKTFKKKSFVFERPDNIVGKGKSPGYSYFLPYPQCFDPFTDIIHMSSNNSLPNNRILDQSKLKAFADDKGYPHGKICSG